MSDFKFKRILLLFLATLTFAETASGDVISFGRDDFFASTVTTSGVNLGTPAFPFGTGPALPADSTFTLPASVFANIVLTNQQGKFFRYDFNLPSGYSNLTFQFQVNVNDEFAVYLNDTLIATQDDTTASNFFVPLPGFTLIGNTATASSKLDFLLGGSSIQSLFQTGPNELTVFATDTLVNGGFGGPDAQAANIGTITFDAPSPVPEPASIAVWAILLLTVAAACCYMRRQHQQA